MKTKHYKRRCTLLVSAGFFLALLLGAGANVYADDQAADRPALETKEGKNTKRNEQAMEPDTIHGAVHLVGPSGEEIHDFLYPTAEDGNLLTRAN